jgi:hypothetical protein
MGEEASQALSIDSSVKRFSRAGDRDQEEWQIELETQGR